jgi:Fe-coproporphyrin III synthase
MDGILAVTYRCNSRCSMCYTWKYQGESDKEIRASDLAGLPPLVRLNITGGEPFLREDLSDILAVATEKAKRVVISSNGFLTKRILEVMAAHRNVGVRISIDGVGAVHDGIRGVPKAYERALATLQGLKELGIKDLGIAVTVSDGNAGELLPLYRLAKQNCVELATAIVHNAYYFHKADNNIRDRKRVESGINLLVAEFLRSSRPKDWFRAYFTRGIIDHMYGKPRAMRCTMARDSFFIDPYGFVRPCNVMDLPYGNVKERDFSDIWSSRDAEEARRRVDRCEGNCWMIGSVGHLMRKKALLILFWIARNKLSAHHNQGGL